MSCGATVFLRLTDPDSGEQLLTQSGVPLSVCIEAPVNQDICSLADLASQMQLDGMPARTMRVEVAVWNADDVAAGECPIAPGFELFDLFGRPKTDLSPQPAFAGAAYFRAGDDADVTVPLACPNPGRLDVDSCAANLPTVVTAAVTDIGSMQLLRKEQAAEVSVSVGAAQERFDDQGASFFVLESSALSPLSLDLSGATPIYRDEVQLPFISDLVCSTTNEDVAQATTNVFCEEVPDTQTGNDDLNIFPLLLRKPVLDAALAALGLQTFPEQGLVIGRVVDEGFSPLAGVVVTPSAGSVLYLNDDLTVAAQGLSTNSAFFVSTDVPYGASWTASHFDGRRHSGQPRGGLVEGKLSTIMIRMTGDVIGE